MYMARSGLQMFEAFKIMLDLHINICSSNEVSIDFWKFNLEQVVWIF